MEGIAEAQEADLLVYRGLGSVINPKIIFPTIKTVIIRSKVIDSS